MYAIFDFYVTTTKGDKSKCVVIESDSELLEVHLNDEEKIFLDADAVAELIRILSDVHNEMDKE